LFTCETCGSRFDLRQEVLDRYPGWVPRQCLDCRNGPETARQARPSKSVRVGNSATKNRDLTLAEVLERYTEGPDTGVFTDGASEGNPGPGGWGAVMVVEGEIISEDHGSDPDTTNNRMELTALIAGLRMFGPERSIDVYTDSQLVVNIVNTWAAGWEQRRWTKKSAGPIANLELVKEAYHLARRRPGARITWIPAHSGYRWNEYADSLATAYRRQVL
jgi:ribonuclease HI